LPTLNREPSRNTRTIQKQRRRQHQKNTEPPLHANCRRQCPTKGWLRQCNSGVKLRRSGISDRSILDEFGNVLWVTPEYAAPTELGKCFWRAFATKIALLRSWNTASPNAISVKESCVPFHRKQRRTNSGSIFRDIAGMVASLTESEPDVLS
jgi:hypothetical protein